MAVSLRTLRAKGRAIKIKRFLVYSFSDDTAIKKGYFFSGWATKEGKARALLIQKFWRKKMLKSISGFLKTKKEKKEKIRSLKAL